ncbi:MAG: cohesin domain-containing protein [Oscillospiraceae bacterium]
MKKFMKNVLTVCLTASLAVAAVGCSDKNSSDSGSTSSQLPMETVSLDQVKQELTFNYKQGGPSVDATEANENDAVEEETIMEEVTEMVAETDAEGQPATNEEGIVKMQPVVVETRAVVANSNTTPTNNNNNNTANNSSQDDNSNNNNDTPFPTRANSNNNTPPAPADNSNPDAPATPDAPENVPAPTVTPVETPYTPVYDTCKAYWLDMTQMGDYDFNGEFLVITFQVKDNVPDGNYPLTIATTDIASWDLSQYTPHIINGEVAINSTPAAQEDIPADEFTLKLNSVTAKPGEEVTVTMDLQNNPGFCGFVIDVQYDSNALEIIEAKGGKDFQKAVTVNAGGNNSSSAQ